MHINKEDNKITNKTMEKTTTMSTTTTTKMQNKRKRNDMTPSLAIAMAWLQPFPPGPTLYFFPKIVSPIDGILGPEKLMSATKIPKTVISLINQP